MFVWNCLNVSHRVNFCFLLIKFFFPHLVHSIGNILVEPMFLLLSFSFELESNLIDDQNERTICHLKCWACLSFSLNYHSAHFSKVAIEVFEYEVVVVADCPTYMEVHGHHHHKFYYACMCVCILFLRIQCSTFRISIVVSIFNWIAFLISFTFWILFAIRHFTPNVYSFYLYCLLIDIRHFHLPNRDCCVWLFSAYFTWWYSLNVIVLI